MRSYLSVYTLIERQKRYTDKLGTDPMAYRGLNKWTMTPTRKAGEIPRVITRVSLSMENVQADAGRDGQTRLARPNSQARTGTRNS